MSKIYLIETRQTYIIGYAVIMDDDMDPKEIAQQVIMNTSDDTVELYQWHVGEQFDQCIPLKDGQLVKVFRAKNDYLAGLSDEEIVGKFMMDFRKNEEEK